MKLIKFIILFLIAHGVLTVSNFAQASSYNGVTFSFKLTDGKGDESKTSFKIGEEIVIITSIENHSFEPFPFPVKDENFLYKFRLTRAGEILPVAYRDDKAQLLTLREETEGIGRRFLADPILPGDTQELETMKLSDRFEKLSPGSYNLLIEYKTSKGIEIDGKAKMLRLTSDVSFDIMP